MKFFRNITLATVLLAASTYLPLSAKSTMAQKAYMFGFSASFNDSIVYFTDIQEIDSVWTSGKNHVLAGRNQYSYQFREFFAQKLDMPRRTCVVVSSLKRKDVEKKYAKMKKQYMEKNAGKYDVRFLSPADFRFHAVDMSEEANLETKRAAKPKIDKEKMKEAKEKAKETKAKAKKKAKEIKSK